MVRTFYFLPFCFATFISGTGWMGVAQLSLIHDFWGDDGWTTRMCMIDGGIGSGWLQGSERLMTGDLGQEIRKLKID